LTALLVAAGVAGAIWLALGFLHVLDGFERLELSVGAGLVACETTRHTVRWVAERHGARGPLSDWLADMARASALVPVIGLGVIFAYAPDAPLFSFPEWWRLAVGLGLGAVMGLVAAVLLGREFRRDESWGILLGTTLLAAGVATRLGLSAVATLFTMGLTMSAVSRHRLEIKFMVQPTEKPVLLPVVLLAGVCVDFKGLPNLWLLVAVGLVARLAAELVRGAVLTLFLRPARPAGPRLGLGMSSTGVISLAVAVTLNLRLPGSASGAVLLLAAAGVLLGELIGPAELRRALERAGETHAEEPQDIAPVSLSSAALRSSDFPDADRASDVHGAP